MASVAIGKRAQDPFGGGVPLALLTIAFTLFGFFPSFFANPLALDAWHLVHGIAATGWVALVLVQASLIRRRSFAMHRTLGWSSLALFAVLVVSSLKLVQIMLSGASGMPIELGRLLGFSDLVTLPLMIGLYAAALVLRSDRHVHSRLVSGTLLVGVIPAAGRAFAAIPWLEGLRGALHPTYLMVLAVLALAIWRDRQEGRLRWPFPLMFAWFAAAYAGVFWIAEGPWFTSVALAIGALSS